MPLSGNEDDWISHIRSRHYPECITSIHQLTSRSITTTVHPNRAASALSTCVPPHPHPTMPISTTIHIPFALHSALELLAAAKFFLAPFADTPGLSADTETTAHLGLIIRQYALLLLSSSLVGLVFAFRPVSVSVSVSKDRDSGGRTTRLVAAALAVYHLGPVYRAYWRIMNPAAAEAVVQEPSPSSSSSWSWGGPYLHLLCHGYVFCDLLRSALATR
jgi:hypothetical protein